MLLFIYFVTGRSIENTEPSGYPAIDPDEEYYEKFTIDEVIEMSATSPGAFEETQPNGDVLLELDIMYTREQWQERSNGQTDGPSSYKAIAKEKYRWPDNIVPYTVEQGFTIEDLMQIVIAVDEWNSQTCLTLKPRTNEQNYVSIVNGTGCSSYVGMIGGAQRLKLAKGCRHKRTIIHEFGHAIGFYHEQARPDRDDYVTIHEENIKDGKSHNFDKKEDSKVTDRGVAYDYSSIMHYGAKAFSKNGEITITTHDPAWQDLIGKIPDLSKNDAELARIIYNC